MKSYVKKVSLLLSITISMFFSSGVLAACTVVDPIVMVTMETNSLIIQADTPLGGVIARGSQSYAVTCDLKDKPPLEQGITWYIYLSENNIARGAPVSGYSNVVPTILKGIGLRWVNITSHNGPTYMTNTSLNDVNKKRGIIGSIDGTTTIFTNNFELVRIGDIDTNLENIKFDNIAMKQRFNDYIVPGDLHTIVFPVLNATIASCNLSQNIINVNLGVVEKTQFSGVNSTSTNVPFSIDLNCLKGTHVKLTFDSANMEPGFTGVIKLSSGSSASGVGIQVLDKYNKPVVLGQEYDMATATTDNERVSLPFFARYIQTSSRIIAGKANGTLNFTMKYY